nr:hypothetical protein F30B5.3 - Caenorhabditis elegans [Caenorhabditis elegans]
MVKVVALLGCHYLDECHVDKCSSGKGFEEQDGTVFVNVGFRVLEDGAHDGAEWGHETVDEDGGEDGFDLEILFEKGPYQGKIFFS